MRPRILALLLCCLLASASFASRFSSRGAKGAGESFNAAAPPAPKASTVARTADAPSGTVARTASVPARVELKPMANSLSFEFDGAATPVSRYMGRSEALKVEFNGKTPTVGRNQQPRPTHVTTDAPMLDPHAAAKKYGIETPTHRITVPKNKVKDLQTAPDGKATTAEGGAQQVTKHPISVAPDQIHKLPNAPKKPKKP